MAILNNQRVFPTKPVFFFKAKNPRIAWIEGWMVGAGSRRPSRGEAGQAEAQRDLSRVGTLEADQI